MLKYWPKINALTLLFLFVFSFGFGIWGSKWGLPSSARRDLFLATALRTNEFYAELEKVRDERYEKMGLGTVSYAGRLLREGKKFDPPTNLLHCYSSFLLRSHDADEQQTLVTISRLNPLKGQWYPHSFQYGGAYIYPLAVLLGVEHVAHIIRLIPQTAFYYERPDEMAKIFRALRLWSVLGLCFNAIALFFCVRKMSSKEDHPAAPALWASCFYVLAPAILAMAKIGKPHIWAAGWMFLCLQYAFDFKISQRTRSLVLSGVFFGVALGTATSQWIFTPFLIWANWDRHFWIYVKRCFISFGVAGLVYLMLNPTLPFHFQDFMDEARFLSNWYPFKVRASSIPDYYFYMVRLGLGNISFISAMAAVIFLFWKGRERIMKEWAVTLIICLALAAFQVQALSKDPLQVRLSLAGLGFLCYLAVWFTFQFPWGRYLRWAMLLTLLGYGILYNRHFQSDCAPNDNASVASLWIQKNIPKGTVIEHMYSIPTADQFPPIDVNSYKIVAYDPNSRAEQDKFLIMNPMNFHIHDELLAAGYTLEQRFENSPLQRRGLTDHFTNANFPVLIYRKNGTANGRASGPSFLPPTRNFSS